MPPRKGKAQAPRADPYASLTKDQHRELKLTTGFSEQELNALYLMFHPHILRGNEEPTPDAVALADAAELSQAPGITVHPLIHRVLLLHNVDKSGTMTFAEFANAMSALSVRTTLEAKLQFVFDLYDFNGSGTIQATEMFELLRMILGRAHDDHDLWIITQKYLDRFPSGLTFEIFCQMFDVSDINKLTLNL